MISARPSVMHRLFAFLMLAVSLPAAACAPAAPTAVPTSAPSAATQAVPPQSSASDWDTVVAAAKQEGTVAVIGPPGADRRDSLVQPFENRYGISVEYLAEPGAGMPPRISSERQAGQYHWDVVVAGALETLLLPLNVLDPMEPALLPENKDPNVWRGGSMEFLDPGRTILVMTPFQRGTLFVNTNLVNEGEIKSYKDLLDPKWQGKIAIDDPRRAGPGQATFTFFYLHPDLGPDFIRGLAKQDLVVLSDYAQEVDMAGQGRYPIVVGTSDSLVLERQSQGVPITIVDPRTLKEGSDVSPASGMTGLFNRPPHPNAAKVYLNWLLSEEGQESFGRGAGYPSARLDVPTDYLPAWRIPQPGATKTYGLETRAVLDTGLNPLLQEVLGS